MLFFIDESFQTVAGAPVGALGAVAMPVENYNRFSRAVYKVKRDLLGAQELDQCELKGNSCFAKSAFRYDQSEKGPSLLLTAVGKVAALLGKNDAVVFALWTATPADLSLRSTHPYLSPPYFELVRDFYRLMKQHPQRLGHLLFDQVDHKQDRRAACAIQNWMTRSSYRHMLPRRFLQVPYFTHSALSPGLQSADLVAYLAAQQADPMFRPELGAWWDTFSELAMVFTLSGGGAVSTTRACSAPPAKPVDLPREGDRRVLHGL